MKHPHDLHSAHRDDCVLRIEIQTDASGDGDWHRTTVERRQFGQVGHEVRRALDDMIPGLLIAHGFSPSNVLEDE